MNNKFVEVRYHFRLGVWMIFENNEPTDSWLLESVTKSMTDEEIIAAVRSTFIIDDDETIVINRIDYDEG